LLVDRPPAWADAHEVWRIEVMSEPLEKALEKTFQPA
jgi:hypothetical protein